MVGGTKAEVFSTSFRGVSGEGGWEQVPDPTRSVVVLSCTALGAVCLSSCVNYS